MKWLAKIMIGIGIMDAFVHLLFYPGHGTAINGKEDAGRYYLGSHGNYREVSCATFQYCLVQDYADMAAVCLMIGGVGILCYAKKESHHRAA